MTLTDPGSLGEYPLLGSKKEEDALISDISLSEGEGVAVAD